MPSIGASTQDYEQWLKTQVQLIREDLRFKHLAMRKSVFTFFRGTFFRWAQCWPEWCPTLVSAPRVVSVGDLHIENFGTWRDEEGRLVWGVNDFDEAWPLPYTSDLARLATSAVLAGQEHDLSLQDSEMVDSILEGYAAGLEASGSAFILAEHHASLRAMALSRLRDAKKFWQKLDAEPIAERAMRRRVVRILRKALPDAVSEVRYLHRRSGMGSLGRERVTVVAEYKGGKVSREAKAIAPSACSWAERRNGPRRRWQRWLLLNELRCRDPFVRLERDFIVRRLAPDCSRIDLKGLPEGQDQRRLLNAMGWETANVHLASGSRRKILRDLAGRKPWWLHAMVDGAVTEVKRDFDAWRITSRLTRRPVEAR